MKGIWVQDDYVRTARLLHNEGEAVATDLVVADGQHVAQAEAGTVGDQHPRRHQYASWATPEVPRHLRGYRKQVPYLVMRPSADEGHGPFDPSKGSRYTAVHQQAVFGSSATERVEHPPVVGNSGGSKMLEGISQVLVNAFRRKFGDAPRQPPAQDAELFPVSGGAAHPAVVQNCVVAQQHGSVTQLGNNTPQLVASTPSSIGYCGYSPLLVGGRPIVRGLWVGVLATLIFLRWTGFALTALLLGQLGVALVEYRRMRRQARGIS